MQIHTTHSSLQAALIFKDSNLGMTTMQTSFKEYL